MCDLANHDDAPFFRKLKESMDAMLPGIGLTNAMPAILATFSGISCPLANRYSRTRYSRTRYSLLTAHYSLLTADCSLLTTHYSLLTTHYSPLTAH